MNGGAWDEQWSDREATTVEDGGAAWEAADIVPTETAGRRTKRWRPGKVLVGAGVVAVLVAAAGGYFLANREEPATWDREVLPLKAFVEKTRGGRFSKAVPIAFESDEAYEKHFAADDGEVPEKAELDDMLGELRALGVVAGELDLVESSETLGAEGTAGFYSTEDGRIHIKGDRRDLRKVSLRATLVHELTHAYDDQHFDLDFGADSDEESKATSGRLFGQTAVVEGSAQTVVWEYVDSLTDAERAEYEAEFTSEEGEEQDPGVAKLEELPAVFNELFGLPYALGPRYLNGLRLSRGEEGYGGAIDQAFRSAPATEEQVLKPHASSLVTELRKVKAPKVKAPEVAMKQDAADVDFGQVSLAIVLAPHVGTDAALAAVDGWSGDAVTRYRPRKGGTPCIRVAVAFDSPDGALRFAGAAMQWAAAIPGASVAPVEGAERTVLLDACDPGPKGPPVKEASPTVTESLVLRTDIVSSFIESGVPAPGAQCVVDAVAAKVGTARLQELNELGEDPSAVAQVQEVFTPAVQACGFGQP